MPGSRNRSVKSKPRPAQLRREDPLQALIEAMPLGVMVWRPDGCLHFANHRASELAGRPLQPGLSAEEFTRSCRLMRVGTTVVYPSEQMPFQRALLGELVRFEDAEFELPDGRRRPVEGWTGPMRDRRGKVRYALTAFSDITERRSAEAEHLGESRVLEMVAAGAPLGETLETLSRIFEALSDGMLASILLLEDGVRVRHAAAPSLPESWTRLVDGQPIGPNQGSCGTAAFLKTPIVAADILTDARWVKYRDAALSHGLRACWAVPILGPDQAVLGTFALYYSEPRQPTPRLLELATHASHLAAVAIQHHRQAMATQESETRARLIVENALDANVLIDSDGIVTGWTGRATAMFGWTREEAIGRRLAQLIIPERFRAQHELGLRRYQESGEGPILNRRLEISALHRDGHEFPVELAVTPIKRADRTIFSAFIQDLTPSRQAAQALRESQEHLSLVYEHVADVLFQLSIEPDGYRFVSINPAFCETTGLAADRVIGKRIEDVIPEPSRTVVLEHYAEAVRSRKTVRWEESTAYPAGVKHGDVAITPVFDAHGNPRYLIGSVHDVTDRKRMESEVRQLQKLEAIGRLSGGIAHDFNNILGVIIGVGQMLLETVEDAAQRSQVEEIVRAGERGAKLTRQFLAFGRKQMLQAEVLDLNTVVRNLESMLRRLIREDISLVTRLAPGLWRVEADPGQIEQVLLNLSVNARDAMPDGGTVVIETANVELDQDFVAFHSGAVAGPFAQLTVSDQGIGMDEETQKRIFEPFFTTKDPGAGSGLGLATVYGIVKQSGGYIWVESRPGAGSRFMVCLPRSATTAAEGPLAELPRGARPGSGCINVLLVEDEPALRRAFQRMLKRPDYRITVVGNGEDALAAVRSGGLTPDLLVTDMVMPGMSGSELVERLRALQPGLKVLPMSGYVDQSMVRRGVLPPGTPFLQKPFTASELTSAIAEVLRSG